MSEKVTFGELIEAIAEDTDRSKQFTHDFLKDFVDVINGGLEEDGNVNIAGFGKFKLRRVDEREGYNPQTEEKITIPAHNKIVFKPYKDLRELVNAPYAHMEPEIIEEESEEASEETDSVEPTEEKSGQDDFIPTGPPTSHKNPDEEESDSQEQPTSQSQSPETEEDDDGDIVEFGAGDAPGDEQEIDEELNEFLGGPEPADEASEPTEEQKPDSDESPSSGQEESADEPRSGDEQDEQQEPQQEETPFALDEEDDSAIEDEPQPEPAPAIGSTRQEGKQNSSIPVIIAAAFILLVVAGSAWYFSLFSGGNGEQPNQMAVQETTSSSQAQHKPASEQQRPKDKAKQQASPSAKTQQAKAPNTSQAQQTAQQATSSAASASAQATQPADKDKITQTIQKGQTLWSMAEEKYGNPRLWPWIYGNNDRLRNPDNILAGNSLTVPLPSGPHNALNAADSVGVAKGFIATYRWYKGRNASKAKNHLWGAKEYHNDIRSIADVKIDQADLAYVNRVR